MTTKTRAQTIVTSLFDANEGISHDQAKHLDENGLAKQLPGMLLRHGLLQVVAFSGRPKKDKPEKKAAESAETLQLKLLERGMRAVLGTDGVGFSLKLSYLGNQDATTLLFLTTLAIDVAQWMERVVEAKSSAAE